MSRIAILKFLDASIGFILCWFLGFIRFLAGHRTPPNVDPAAIKRILVIRPGGLGDMVLLLPVIARIREQFPKADLHLVCERRNMEVLRLACLAVHATAYDASPFRLLRRLFTEKYDVAIDTEQFHNLSAVLAFFSRAPIRIGFKINPNRNLLYTHLVNYAMDAYEGQQFMRLLGPLGVSDLSYRLEGTLSTPGGGAEKMRSSVETVLAEKPFVVIYPGSTTAYKRWDSDRFCQLVMALEEKRGLSVVLVGGREARREAEVIMRKLPSPSSVYSLVGRFSLAETVNLMKRSKMFIGGDSGLGHLAVAAGVPTVILFGPSDHAKWGIDDFRHAIVCRPIACSPCFIFGYHRLCRTISCMAEIKVEDVLAACDRLLATQGEAK